MNVGIYVRLSNDDGLDGKSVSIENQIEKLTLYLNDNKYHLFDVYVDDGYSGSNFNRPGFKKMIEAIENNQIDTIVVKDLSRLGRNYIEVGKYVDEYFVEKNIRFISVDDNYDSTKEQDESLTIRNFLNHLYLKDCSKKIQQSIKQRSTTKNMSIDGCYGYKYDENKRIIIDEIVKQNIIDIFNYYDSGLSTTKIARKLKNDKVYSPGYYRYLRLGHTYSLGNKKKTLEDPYYWSHSSISSILRNIQYIGHASNVKVSRANNHYRVKEPTIIHNTQEPIIQEELFYRVQDKLKEAGKFHASDEENRLRNIVRCGCGHAMTYSSVYGGYKIPIYRCNYCNNVVKLKELHQILFDDCKKIIMIQDQNKLKKIVEKAYLSDNLITSIETLTTKKEMIDKQFDNLFKQKINGEISIEEYKSRTSELNKSNQEIEKEISKHSSEIAKVKMFGDKYKVFIEKLNSIKNETNELKIIKHLVRKVVVKNYRKQQIEYVITYKL